MAENGDKKIEFILQMQAQFESNLGRLEANVGRLEANVARNTASIDTLRQSVAEVAIILRESIRNGDERMSELAESRKATDEQLRRTDEHLRRTDEHLRETDEHLRETAEHLRETDDRLNALISIVERHVSGPGHGPLTQ